MRSDDSGPGAPELVPLRRMAARLKVPTRWLRERAEAGDVPALRAGDRWLFRADLAAAALAAMVTDAPDPERRAEL
jgi:hypothetical protein